MQEDHRPAEGGGRDQLTVSRLCHLEDEAQTLRAIVREDGPMLRKPIVSPRAEVLGETTDGRLHAPAC